MKNFNTILSQSLITLICLFFFCSKTNAQTYTSTYNGVSYTSTRPYNLNVIYFVPNDIPLDATYKTRLSAMLLWGQNFYKQNMINNGYGPKTFGLFTKTTDPNDVKIILINGSSPSSSYTYGNHTQMNTEINTYFANNPAQKTSEHTLVITATPDQAVANVPFYGLGKICYALDYPNFKLQYLGTNTDNFVGWFGGMMHELGHGLNLPHSHQTNTENNNPNQGMNLMYAGNGTIGLSPTFINRAGSAMLSNCQVFADTPGTFYNGNTAALTSLHTTYTNTELIVSGTFQSNIPVTDVNIYQDAGATPSPGYGRVAWSVPPSGNSFTVHMPINELEAGTPNQTYNLQVELILKNGESTFNYYPFSYVNGVPNITPNLTTNENDTNKNSQSVYPNPVKDELTVDLGPASGKYQIEVIANTGQLLYKTITSDKTLKVPFSGKPTGTYLVTIKSTTNGSSKSFRIIKK